MSLKKRFEDREVLIDALLGQKIIRGDRAIAAAFADSGDLTEFAAGQNVLEQGENDRSVHFLLSGRGQIIINGVRLYPREPGCTVGEMSAINPSIGRSATIEAVENVLTLKVDHVKFAEVGNAHPEMWRLVAQDLASRLEQRNRFVNRANVRPRIFMICSAEALSIAKSIRVGLSHDADIEIWSDDMIFPAGGYPIEALEEQVNIADFGIALCEPDDLVTARGKTSAVPRDNVIFELGFFMSRLGRHRTLLLVPQRTDVTLPSDFKGLTPLPYATADKASDRAVALGPVIDRISAIIEEKGVRASLIENK
ncbi:TIR domain-containing protein [Sphingobium sp. DC-2]|uniref:TIR domain-containing protein n=1 Tax=Sphingobium sp. DC-2 TaxID=1303256 RepID=UPI0004C30ACE|nr:TIR domain-containing protein [Sphingobium sp. DC-2]